MCGISGFLQARPIENGLTIAAQMAKALHHRGPDNTGTWQNHSQQVFLSHARLAIVDLSVSGHQPMVSASGRYALTFNGEVYNFAQLRAELESVGCKFRGRSDTEVLLNGIEIWGLKKTLKRCVGMFALALWDEHRASLSLARDRMGEKPLYFGWAGRKLSRKSLIFSSELKAFKQFPGFKGEVDRDALTLYLRHSAIPAPHTIYRGVYKLPAATLLEIPIAQLETGGLCNSFMPELQSQYWDFAQVVADGRANRLQASDETLITQLEDLLRQSIAEKMIADVPLGAFLSGGYDSTAIVALMQSLSHTPVHTYSIGFHEQAYNEAHHAKAVAQHLGTKHTELYVNAQQALSVIPKLPQIYDEPFSDSSQIPTFLVSEMTQKHVTVALSGDGGDELFGGYHRYSLGNSLWSKLSKVPSPLRLASAYALQSAPSKAAYSALLRLTQILPSQYHLNPQSTKLATLTDFLKLPDADSLYFKLLSHWENTEALVLNAKEPTNTFFPRFQNLGEFIEKMMAIDTVHYLADDILAKVDRASMAVSLETRVPMLDHRVVEFAWRLPLDCKLRHGETKWILKKLTDRYVPRTLMDRPKMGFGAPIDSWLRGELREWANELLSPQKLNEQGFFKPQLITEKWQEHQKGTRDWHSHLWDILMFQAWLEKEATAS